MDEERRKNKHWLAWTGLAVVATLAAVYGGSFGHTWTYDDYIVIIGNSDIESLRGFFANSYPGRPLREISFLLDHTLFGFAPGGWHLQQLFWHGLNGILLALLAVRLGVRPWLATLAALLFLVHPLQVETVANLSHRKDILLLTFALLALLAWLRQAEDGVRVWHWRFIAVICMVLAWLAKETAVALPVLLVAAELTVVPAERRWLLSGRRPIWIALAVVAAALYLWSTRVEGGGGLTYLATGVLAKMNINVMTPQIYLLTLLKSWSFMTFKIVWPTNLALEYVFTRPSGWGDPWVVATLLLMIASVGLIILAWFRARPVFLLLLWALLLWLPVSNVWPGAYMAADRYFYAPSAGLFLALVLAVDRLAVRRWLAGGLFLTVLVMALLSWRQNAVWTSNFTLFTQAVKVSPTSSSALTGLGEAYVERKEPDLALPYLTRAAFNWNYPLAYWYLGRIYDSRGDMTQAARWYCIFAGSRGQVPARNISKAQVAEYVRQKYGEVCR